MAIDNLLKGYKVIIENSIFSSKPRKQIYKLLEERPMTISELRERVKVDNKKFNYRTIWQHIKSLEELGIVETEKKEHESGKPVYVKLKVNLKLFDVLEDDKK